MNTPISPEDLRAEAAGLRAKWRNPDGSVRNTIPRDTSTASQRSHDLSDAQRLIRHARMAEYRRAVADGKRAIITGQRYHCAFCGTLVDEEIPMSYWGEFRDSQSRRWYGCRPCSVTWGKVRAYGEQFDVAEFAAERGVTCGDTSSDE